MIQFCSYHNTMMGVLLCAAVQELPLVPREHLPRVPDATRLLLPRGDQVDPVRYMARSCNMSSLVSRKQIDVEFPV